MAEQVEPTKFPTYVRDISERALPSPSITKNAISLPTETFSIKPTKFSPYVGDGSERRALPSPSMTENSIRRKPTEKFYLPYDQSDPAKIYGGIELGETTQDTLETLKPKEKKY
jgi:hypothetical protein